MSISEDRTDSEDKSLNHESIADKTWRLGFVHLTVDGDGLVSLWDEEQAVISYLQLELTEEQKKLIAKTMRKGGPTP